jgi:hypothetical protein
MSSSWGAVAMGEEPGVPCAVSRAGVMPARWARSKNVLCGFFEFGGKGIWTWRADLILLAAYAPLSGEGASVCSVPSQANRMRVTPGLSYDHPFGVKLPGGPVPSQASRMRVTPGLSYDHPFGVNQFRPRRAALASRLG